MNEFKFQHSGPVLSDDCTNGWDWFTDGKVLVIQGSLQSCPLTQQSSSLIKPEKVQPAKQKPQAPVL